MFKPSVTPICKACAQKFPLKACEKSHKIIDFSSKWTKKDLILRKSRNTKIVDKYMQDATPKAIKWDF